MRSKDGWPHMRGAGGINLHQHTHHPLTLIPRSALDPLIRPMHTSLDQRTTEENHTKTWRLETWILLQLIMDFRCIFKLSIFVDASDYAIYNNNNKISVSENFAVDDSNQSG